MPQRHSMKTKYIHVYIFVTLKYKESANVLKTHKLQELNIKVSNCFERTKTNCHI